MCLADLVNEHTQWFCAKCNICGHHLPTVNQSEDEILIRVASDANNNLYLIGYHTVCWYNQEKKVSSKVPDQSAQCGNNRITMFDLVENKVRLLSECDWCEDLLDTRTSDGFMMRMYQGQFGHLILQSFHDNCLSNRLQIFDTFGGL